MNAAEAHPTRVIRDVFRPIMRADCVSPSQNLLPSPPTGGEQPACRIADRIAYKHRDAGQPIPTACSFREWQLSVLRTPSVWGSAFLDSASDSSKDEFRLSKRILPASGWKTFCACCQPMARGRYGRTCRQPLRFRSRHRCPPRSKHVVEADVRHNRCGQDN